MMFDDDTPLPRPARLERLPLERLSVAELEAYLVELRTEMARVEQDIAQKGRHRDAAEAFFRKP